MRSVHGEVSEGVWAVGALSTQSKERDFKANPEGPSPDGPEAATEMCMRVPACVDTGPPGGAVRSLLGLRAYPLTVE